MGGVRRQMSVQARAMSQMAFTFAAPNGVHYDAASVKQVDVPSFSGTFGILPDHVPALAVLAPGVVTVFEDSGDTKKFFRTKHVEKNIVFSSNLLLKTNNK